MTDYVRNGQTFKGVDQDGATWPGMRIAAHIPTLVAGHQYNQSCSSVFTMTVPSGATHALVSVDGGNCRVREDATNPTSTDGVLLTDGFVGEMALPNPLRFLQVSGTVKLNISYRKYS